MVIIAICLLTENYRFKANNGIARFRTQFCNFASNGFGAFKSREVSLKENACDFQLITMVLINLKY